MLQWISVVLLVRFPSLWARSGILSALKFEKTAIKISKAVTKIGDAAFETSKAAKKVGDAATNIGEAAIEASNASTKIGDAAVEASKAATKIGDSAVETSKAVTENSKKIGDAAVQIGDAASKFVVTLQSAVYSAAAFFLLSALQSVSKYVVIISTIVSAIAPYIFQVFSFQFKVLKEVARNLHASVSRKSNAARAKERKLETPRFQFQKHYGNTIVCHKV